MQFGYHNHWFEFLPVNGKLPYDELLKDCDAKPGEDGNGSLLDYRGRLRSLKYFDLIPDASRWST